MPDSFYDGTNVTRQKYCSKVQEVITTYNPNKHIPPPSKSHLRVMTYNIFMHQNAYGSDNLLELEEVIKSARPDVIFMQEVLDTSTWPRSRFSLMMARNGYGMWHFAQHTSKSQNLGNVVAVKDGIRVLERYKIDLPEPYYTKWGRHIMSREEELENITPKWKSGRTVSHLTIMLEDRVTKLHLLSTHLGCEWTNENRIEQSKFLVERVGKMKDGMYILGGDFNAWPDSAEIQLFTGSGVGKNVFDDLNWNSPKYTCWVGTPVDYILTGSGLHGKAIGAYVYYTLASDHLPLIADLNITVARV